MDLHTENPAALAGANRVDDIKALAKLDVFNTNDNARESLAVRSIARRFRLTIPHARVICELYGLGGAA